MEQFIEFAGNHLMLFAALAVGSVLLAQNLLASGGKSSVHPLVATNLINREDAIILDIRPMADFSKGHIINAINIPNDSLKNQLKQLEKYRDTPIIVACRSGAQSSGACNQLRKEGFERVHNLQGGILAWESANLPISHK